MSAYVVEPCYGRTCQKAFQSAEKHVLRLSNKNHCNKRMMKIHLAFSYIGCMIACVTTFSATCGGCCHLFSKMSPSWILSFSFLGKQSIYMLFSSVVMMTLWTWPNKGCVQNWRWRGKCLHISILAFYPFSHLHYMCVQTARLKDNLTLQSASVAIKPVTFPYRAFMLTV